MIDVQAPAAVVLVRPRHFRPNPATSADNAFQSNDAGRTPAEISAAAYAEVTAVAANLRALGVVVELFDDESDDRPDAVFCNNWFSTHPDGRVALYPMYAANRRGERRDDILATLRRGYRVAQVIDYSAAEQRGLFLEGTGAMVLDHTRRIAFGARSRRLSEPLFLRFCRDFDFEPVLFDATDAAGTPIYHTNVMMCVGTDVALVGLSCISRPGQREMVRRRLAETGRVVIALTRQQIADFAGNAIELQGSHGRLLAMSRRAFQSLTEAQLAILERNVRVLPLDVPTLELAGGSVRCMIGGVHLARRAVQNQSGPRAAGTGPAVSVSGRGVRVH